MQNAIADALDLGYSKAVLIGTDIPELEAETVDTAFAMLDACDVVMGPTEDGGFYLIGMKEVRHEAFSARVYGVDTVFNETITAMVEAGINVGCVDEYSGCLECRFFKTDKSLGIRLCDTNQRILCMSDYDGHYKKHSKNGRVAFGSPKVFSFGRSTWSFDYCYCGKGNFGIRTGKSRNAYCVFADSDCVSD